MWNHKLRCFSASAPILDIGIARVINGVLAADARYICWD